MSSKRRIRAELSDNCESPNRYNRQC